MPAEGRVRGRQGCQAPRQSSPTGPGGVQGPQGCKIITVRTGGKPDETLLRRHRPGRGGAAGNFAVWRRSRPRRRAPRSWWAIRRRRILRRASSPWTRACSRSAGSTSSSRSCRSTRSCRRRCSRSPSPSAARRSRCCCRRRRRPRPRCRRGLRHHRQEPATRSAWSPRRTAAIVKADDFVGQEGGRARPRRLPARAVPQLADR